MNDNTAFTILGVSFLVFLGFGLTSENSGKRQLELEAIKSGLIQKVDPETKQVIWTKP
jgi:hypothetical protein